MIFVGKMMISMDKKMIFVNEKTISENKPSFFAAQTADGCYR